MKTLKLLLPMVVKMSPFAVMLVGILASLVLWKTLPMFLGAINPTVGLMDSGIWQLLLFSVISFLLFLCTSLALFHWFLSRMALPTINMMVSQFNTLMVWQQFAFYWASFALLLLGSILSLIAIF